MCNDTGGVALLARIASEGMATTRRNLKVILVGTDLTKQSQGALRLGAELASAARASLVVAHVVELPARLRSWSPATSGPDRDAYRALLAGQVASAEATLPALLSQHLPGVQTQNFVRPGDAAEVLNDLAVELGADLIVVARGRGGRLGRNAERLARRSGRAVLIAPVEPPVTLFAVGGRKPNRRGTRHRPRAASSR